MTGRTIIVTGASGGIGYEVARYLCEGGNDTILACRDENKAKTAIDKIKKLNPNALASFMKVHITIFYHPLLPTNLVYSSHVLRRRVHL